MIREIKGGLYVGNCDDARRKGDEFDDVISMASPPECSTEQYLIDDGEHNYSKFSNAVDDVIDRLEENRDVLVHCNAGISRSVSVCIAVCVVYFSIDYQEAYDKCQCGFMYPNDKLIESAEKYINQSQLTDG